MKDIISVITNATQAGIRYIGNGFGNVSQEEKDKRMLICIGCKNFNNNWCGECGCYLPAKTWMMTESCPLGYWENSNSGVVDLTIHQVQPCPVCPGV